jgi:predicted nucleotidyltransferase
MMKTLHEKIAEDVIEELQNDSSVLGICVGGSLARDEIRPDSDIDFGVITESGESHQFIEKLREGIKVDMSITPLRVLLETVDTHPFLLYLALLEKIVYDPKGTLKQVRDKLETYFDGHPEIVEFWKEKLELYKAAKMKGEVPQGLRSVLDEAERRFSEDKKVSRIWFQH